MSLSNLVTFFKNIYGKAQGWLCIPCKNHVTGGWEQTEKNFFLYPSDTEKAIQLILSENKAGKCVYFTPSLFIKKGSTEKDNLQPEIRALFADIDEHEDPESINPKPTICWETSPGRYQGVWLLESSVSWEEAEKLNKRLTYHIGADKAGWGQNKVLRVPGTVNCKPEYNLLEKGVPRMNSTGEILWNDGPLYTFKRLGQAVSQQKEKAATAEISALPDKLPTYTEALTKFGPKIPEEVWTLLNTSPDVKEDWSTQLWKLERLLLGSGIPPEYVFAIAKGSPWNKYDRDNRPDEHLWLEVHKAGEDKTKKELERVVSNDENKDLETKLIEEVLKARMSFLSWVMKGEATAPKSIIPGILYSGSLILIYGLFKSGKSTFIAFLINKITWGGTCFTLDLGKHGGCITFDNREVLGRPLIPQPQKVVIISEEHSSLWAERLREANWDMIEVLPSHLVKRWSAQGHIETVLKAYELLPENESPDLIVLDPLTKLLAIEDENNSAEIERKIGPFEEFTHRSGIAVCFIHHPRKSGGEHGEEIRGSGAIAANVDYFIGFNRTPGEKRPTHRTLKFLGRYPDLPKHPLEIIWDEETGDYSLDAALPKGTEEKIISVMKKEEKRFTVKELESLTGISDKTLKQKLKNLIDKGRVRVAEESTGRGSPTKFYELLPEIDIRVVLP